jgi:hypothetical protein
MNSQQQFQGNKKPITVCERRWVLDIDELDESYSAQRPLREEGVRHHQVLSVLRVDDMRSSIAAPRPQRQVGLAALSANVFWNWRVSSTNRGVNPTSS